MILSEDISQYFNTQRPENLRQFSVQEGYLGVQLFEEPDLTKSIDADVAIIGLDETRSAYPLPYVSKADNVRYWLYQLASFGNLKVADFGNLILGNSPSDTYHAVEYITESLVGAGIIPIYIGGSHDLTLPVVRGLQKVRKTVEFGLIDSCFDILNVEGITSRSYLAELFKKNKKKVFGNIIGYQTYFTTQKQSDALDKCNVSKYRLGIVRQQLGEMEPVLRDCDFVSFDAGAVRQADMQASHQPSPNGLYTEEACQLASYAGLSDKSKAFGIFGVMSKNTPLDISAHLSAQIIWHYICGLSQREKDYPACGLDKYKKIFVKFDASDNDIVFYQNLQNDRFWMEIPKKDGKNCIIVSCSKKDYMSLVNNEIPERIKRALMLYGI